MSCFSGSFLSLPGVRCDRFDSLCGGGGSTAAADQFFLSHCHTDHMVGLEKLGSYIRKKASESSSYSSKLYLSHISKNFVTKKYPDIPYSAMTDLLPNQPLTVAVSDTCQTYSLRVTAVPANHCPGSLMFMFESLDADGVISKRILYTGDFRFDNPQAPLTGLRALHSGTSPLDIDEMYLDTTFCSKKYTYFPSRQLAEEKIWEICRNWIKKNTMYRNNYSKHVVLFQLPARYGYENILQHLYQKSSNKWRVHVPPTKFSEYLCNSSLADCTDPDPNIAHLIHACTTNFKKSGKKLDNSLPCQASGVSVCHIKPSAMYFTKGKMDAMQAAGEESLVSVSQGGGSYRVCYSTHSSLTELEKFVRHFSPQQITPCAIPPNTTREEVRELLASFLQPSQTSDASEDSIDLPPITLSPHNPTLGVPTDNDRYDPDIWVSPSPPEQNKRKTEDTEHDPIQAKVFRLDREDSYSKISFNDTLDLEANVVLEGAAGSDEDIEEAVAATKAPVQKAFNDSFSLVLEPSDDEESILEINGNSVEIIEQRTMDNVEQGDTLNDTPEIEDLLAEAEENNLPSYVIKTMREFKRKKDEIIIID